jgi:hypothetical protein
LVPRTNDEQISQKQVLAWLPEAPKSSLVGNDCFQPKILLLAHK